MKDNDDTISVGITLYLLLIGVAPFKGKTPNKLMEEAKVGYVSFTHAHWKLVSPQAQAFVKKLIYGKQLNGNTLRLL